MTEKNPHIIVSPFQGRVRVISAGYLIADSKNAVALTEQGYHTVYYLPKREIRMELFVPSAKQTVCPHKGMASYWSLETANAVIEDAAWSYEHPHADVAAIAGMLAFSPEKIDAIEATSAVPG